MEDIHWARYAGRYKPFQVPGGIAHFESPRCVVCIPVYAEPDITRTLESLSQCDAADEKIHVLLLFNQDQRMSVTDQAVHMQSWTECQDWIRQHSFPHVIFEAFFLQPVPDVKWGVGWARKVLMDEAARILPQGGVMICLDGDCTVQSNYLKTIYRYFYTHPTCQAASVYFEHLPDIADEQQVEAITAYELHLRYLEWGKRWAGHPFAGHTVGSAMAVRRSAYLQQGGMNTRQAGEDFYFLQKFIEVNGLHLIQDTTVYPSSRVSNKVPFGTGRAMGAMIKDNIQWQTTAFESFRMIRPLFNNLLWLRNTLVIQSDTELYEGMSTHLHLPAELIMYLKETEFVNLCSAIAKETTTQEAFEKRFFRKFNSFRMIRYLHDMRDRHFQDVPVMQAAMDLALAAGWTDNASLTCIELLSLYRDKDRQLPAQARV